MAVAIHLEPSFKRTYRKLPSHIKEDFDKNIILFLQNPFTPSLGTHKLHGKLSGCYAFCLRDGWRVLFEFASDNAVRLLAIGKHDEYQKWGK